VLQTEAITNIKASPIADRFTNMSIGILVRRKRCAQGS
jgi:hypothetical protein